MKLNITPKIYLFLLFPFFISFSSVAQTNSNNASDAVFHKGTMLLGLAAGVSIDNFANAMRPHLIPELVYDQGFFDNVGIGNIGIGGVASCKFMRQPHDWPGGYKQYQNNFYLGVRGTYHFTQLKVSDAKFDPYAGVMLGVKISHYGDTWFKYTRNNVTAAKGIFVGVRYVLDDRFSAFSELGYNISFISIGIMARL
ncbi:MAG: hypothetical protein JSS82_18880 [Bacteroidetes bacterium]|nr:hypothetical protein [Bacteroidota bacterium]